MYKFYFITIALVITNGPIDTTVCIGSVANISCGFVNYSVSSLPDWRIIRRSVINGSVISNMSFTQGDIANDDKLRYIPDTTSGVNMSLNSRLVVGPVDETYNQSSYQCAFSVLINNVIQNIKSSIGTLTVTGTYVHTYRVHMYISRRTYVHNIAYSYVHVCYIYNYPKQKQPWPVNKSTAKQSKINHDSE